MANVILTGFSKQVNPGSAMQQHALMSRRYNNLMRSIDTCLSLPESMRPHPSVFIERIGVEIDNLAEYNIDHPNHVVNKFEREFGQIDRLLYGENIVELVKIGRTTGSIVMDVKRSEYQESSTTVSDDVETGMQMIQPSSPRPKPMLPFKLLVGGNGGATSFAMTIRPQLKVLQLANASLPVTLPPSSSTTSKQDLRMLDLSFSNLALRKSLDTAINQKQNKQKSFLRRISSLNEDPNIKTSPFQALAQAPDKNLSN